MAARLDQKQMDYAIQAGKRGARAADVAMHLGVSTRHAYRLWDEYLRTGRAHVQRSPGRPGKEPDASLVRAVLAEHDANGTGAVYTARRVRKKRHISYRAAYRIMGEQAASRRQRPDRAGATGSATSGGIPTPCGTSTGTS